MLAYFYLFTAATLWGLTGILTRFAFEAGLSAYEVAFWRAFIGGLFFLVHGIVTKKIKLNNHENVYYLAFGAFSIGSLFMLYPIAIQYGGAALSVILLYTAPVWVAVFSKILFKEQFSRGKILAIAIGISGVFLVSISSGDLGNINSKAIIFGLLAGFFYATYYPFLSFFKNSHPIAIYALALPTAALVIFFFTDFTPNKTAFTWLILLLLGLLTTYLSMLTYALGLKIVGPVPAVMVCNLEPVVGTFLAYLVWHESFSTLGYFGSFLVVAAVFILAYSEKYKS